MKGLWFVEHNMKRKEGKRGTRTQDILIDLMWKLRSKGFGDRESPTKRGELTATTVQGISYIKIY